MAWFWGSSKKESNNNDNEEEEDDEEEYSEDEFESDEYEEESYEDEDSYEDLEEEDDDDDDDDDNIEDVTPKKKKQENGGVSLSATAAVVDIDASSMDAEHDESHDEDLIDDDDDDEGDKQNPKNGATTAKPFVATTYANEFDDDDDDDGDDDDDDDMLLATDHHRPAQDEMERIQSGVPDQVVGNRNRAPSALTVGGETDDDDDEENAEEDESHLSLDESSLHSEASQEPDEHVTTLAEKQSLLVLAAEHDRVDILNSVLNQAQEDGPTTKQELLHGGIPPLHIAVLNGSTNTATCLLRMGADPSIRPNVKEIVQNQDPQGPPLDVPKQIDGVTAWELAFDNTKKGGSGSGGGVVPKTKQAGLLHAFSAEALRCMGSDEGERLQQLLNAGMPADMAVMGDKSLYDWAVELGAPQCEEILRPAQAAKYETNNPETRARVEVAPASSGKSAVLDRPGSKETAEQLIRQLEELESLAKALSTCLDSLAEEVSVSHGLLLMGGGASALASHVRSLKTLKEQKLQELSRHQEAFENTQDELDYWVNQAGPIGQRVAAEEAPLPSVTRKHSPPPKFASVDEERTYCESLQQRIAATNEKIRKFRVSIADLSEENDRNMQEVEKRGLTGGINLVRGLKDEIREIEFSLDETKIADAVYRFKIDKIQSLLNNGETDGTAGVSAEERSVADTSKASTEHHFNHANGNGQSNRAVSLPIESDSSSDVASQQSGDEMKPSEIIATGQSTALTVRNNGPGPGSLPLSLWQILLRIIGIRGGPEPPPPPRRQTSSYNNQSWNQPAMIV